MVEEEKQMIQRLRAVGQTQMKNHDLGEAIKGAWGTTCQSNAADTNMAERAALQGWMWTFQTKYEVVGEIDGFDPKSTSTRAIK